MANRQCQLWAGILVVNPALKLKTAHAHRRYLYARECCRRETSGQCCPNAGPPSSMVTYTRPASVWRLVVACANPVLHPDLTHSVLLCSYPAGCGGYSFTSFLSQFVQGSSQIEKHVFFLTLIRLIFCSTNLTTTNEPVGLCKIGRRINKRNDLLIGQEIKFYCFFKPVYRVAYQKNGGGGAFIRGGWVCVY